MRRLNLSEEHSECKNLALSQSLTFLAQVRKEKKFSKETTKKLLDLPKGKVL